MKKTLARAAFAGTLAFGAGCGLFAALWAATGAAWAKTCAITCGMFLYHWPSGSSAPWRCGPCPPRPPSTPWAPGSAPGPGRPPSTGPWGCAGGKIALPTYDPASLSLRHFSPLQVADHMCGPSWYTRPSPLLRPSVPAVRPPLRGLPRVPAHRAPRRRAGPGLRRRPALQPAPGAPPGRQEGCPKAPPIIRNCIPRPKPGDAVLFPVLHGHAEKIGSLHPRVVEHHRVLPSSWLWDQPRQPSKSGSHSFAASERAAQSRSSSSGKSLPWHRSSNKGRPPRPGTPCSARPSPMARSGERALYSCSTSWGRASPQFSGKPGCRCGKSSTGWSPPKTGAAAPPRPPGRPGGSKTPPNPGGSLSPSQHCLLSAIPRQQPISRNLPVLL